MKPVRLRIPHAGAGMVLGILVAGPAQPVPVEMELSFSGGGGGTLSFDYFGTDPTLIAFDQVSDFTASFEIQGQTWDESHLFGKYDNPVVGDPEVFLVDASGGDGTEWYWDDGKEDQGETEIVGFDNGSSLLTFDEGDLGSRDYRIDGMIAGTYLAATGPLSLPSTRDPIAEALEAISTSPNTASTAGVIAVACPASNRKDPDARFTQDCNVLVENAFSTDPLTIDQASAALGAITADQATVPLSSSRGSLSSQLQNLSARLGALRGGATGVSVRGLTISASEVDGFDGALAGVDGVLAATGGAAGADGGLITLGDGRLAVFVNGAISSGDKDATSNEEGFDFDSWGITAGVDYRFRTDLVAGLAVGYNKNDTEIDNDGGNLDTDGYSVSLYGTYFRGESLYVDGVLTYGSNDYDQERNIRYRIGNEFVNQTASADYDGNQWSGAIGVGYDIPRGPWTFGPVARLQYVSADVDGYSERMSNPSGPGGGWPTRIDDLDQESFTSTIGGNLSRAIGTEWGVVLPQLHLSWVHEFRDDAVAVNGSFLQDPTGGVFSIRSDRPDSDYFNARLGVSMQLARGNSAFLYYNKVFGYRDLDVDTVGAGVRLEF